MVCMAVVATALGMVVGVVSELDGSLSCSLVASSPLALVVTGAASSSPSEVTTVATSEGPSDASSRSSCSRMPSCGKKSIMSSVALLSLALSSSVGGSR